MINQPPGRNANRPTEVGRYTDRYTRYYPIFVTFLFACGLAYEPLYHIIRGSLQYSIIPQDDFYYYYLTSKHFALTGFSSFDGIVPTNGYHPLWMLIIAALSFLMRGNDAGTFVWIEVIQVLSCVVTAWLALRLFRELYGDQKWVPVIAMLVSLFLSVLVFLGMETVVAIPLYLLFIRATMRALNSANGPASALLCGITGTFLFLARLDTLLALGIVFLLFLFYRAGSKKVWLYLAGLIPIIGYFLLNHFVFGNWMPVSAQVKELRGGLHFSIRPIEVIRTPRGSLYFLLTLAGFILTLVRLRRNDVRSGMRWFLFAFPLLFALVLALRLSWSVYVWYFYPFPISAGAALFEIQAWMHPRWKSRIDRLAIPGLAFILVATTIILRRDISGLTTHLNLDQASTQAQPNIYTHAMGIKAFTDTHPGRYAMGDRSGLTAFLTGRPILQLEGLASDQTLVDSIAARADLLTVLRNYGVHYYIVSYPLREFHEHNGHWDLYEPHQQEVLPGTPLMHSKFYAPEVFRFPYPVGAKLTAQDSANFVTRILDISQARPDTSETN